ncbi:hypothetical protein Tcan_18454 [Toxocara canis]|uniref:Uncharacterized protein n=1 Tax=Toxocara canis TaxID=6265 RepID=A0A0B2UY86_TOXCA|nr:hypothetical protein Tcan_18454 [Toxocara canis]
MGNSRSKSHQRRRPWKERLLRLTTRRATCLNMIIVSSFLVFFLLITISLLFFLLIRPAQDRLERLKKEDEIYRSYIGKVTFWECSYGQPIQLTDLCSRCDRSAHIVRHWQTTSDSDHSDKLCWDKVEMVKCSDRRTVCAQVKPHELKQCIGVHGIGMGDLTNSRSEVVVPLVNLNEKSGKVLHVKEIFAMCPTCQVHSRSYRRKARDKCRKRIITMESGWPDTFEVCDGSYVTGEDECEIYK